VLASDRPCPPVPPRNLHGKGGGRRFESVRGLRESPVTGPFCCLPRRHSGVSRVRDGYIFERAGTRGHVRPLPGVLQTGDRRTEVRKRLQTAGDVGSSAAVRTTSFGREGADPRLNGGARRRIRRKRLSQAVLHGLRAQQWPASSRATRPATTVRRLPHRSSARQRAWRRGCFSVDAGTDGGRLSLPAARVGRALAQRPQGGLPDRDPLPAHTVRNATVGGIRDARTAGSRPANAPIRMAEAMPPAHASTGITMAQLFELA
jgi:hypothetical protein